MPLFSRIFRSGRADIEQGLEDLYTEQYHHFTGVPITEARAEVRSAISLCKDQSRKDGTDDLPEKLGDIILAQANRGVADAQRIVERARQDDARDEDIREWWNLSDLERRMVVWSESVFRYANFLSFEEQGLSADEAMMNVRKMFPMYGNRDDAPNTLADNRPLPNEIRGRVDEYRKAYGAAAIGDRIVSFITYNAFVRSEIKNGRL